MNIPRPTLLGLNYEPLDAALHTVAQFTIRGASAGLRCVVKPANLPLDPQLRTFLSDPQAHD